jgi:hypothetical protein
MSTPENPFDRTVWDPVDPEQAIEDPLHGPSAVSGLLEVPPMPLGDGRYYQPGGFYAFGAVYVDAEGQPIYEIHTTPRPTTEIIREQQAVSEWVAAYRRGELLGQPTDTTPSKPEIITLHIDDSLMLGTPNAESREPIDDPVQQTRKFYEGLRDVNPGDENPV